MRVLRPWIAGYLVLCFALAGAVGLSPFLHQVFEHGGQGAWHTHNGPRELTFDVSDAAALAPHESQAHLEPKPHPVFTRNHRPFKLPTAQFAQLVRTLADFVGGPASSADHHGEGHEHHSLAQLLASGLLDQHIDIPLLPHFHPLGDYRILRPDDLLLASIWNTQTPDRGPPELVS